MGCVLEAGWVYILLEWECSSLGPWNTTDWCSRWLPRHGGPTKLFYYCHRRYCQNVRSRGEPSPPHPLLPTLHFFVRLHFFSVLLSSFSFHFSFTLGSSSSSLTFFFLLVDTWYFLYFLSSVYHLASCVQHLRPFLSTLNHVKFTDHRLLNAHQMRISTTCQTNVDFKLYL